MLINSYFKSRSRLIHNKIVFILIYIWMKATIHESYSIRMIQHLEDLDNGYIEVKLEAKFANKIINQ